ncbi:MAG: asparagine synthetase B [Candidatus Binatia bacterium]
MSRIAGIMSEYPSERREHLLTQMLQVYAETGLSYPVRYENRSPAALGFYGEETSSFFSSPEVVVAVDGCIYNLADLQDARAEGDAGIIADLYLRYGLTDAVRKLNGDFALALYDFRDSSLYLARDRFGVKPLYYCRHNGFFAFASRPRPLLTLPGVSSEPNRKFVALFAAGHYRYFDNDPERSPYAAIDQVPAATVLCWKNGHVSGWAYWQLNESPDLSGSEEGLAEQYRDLLFDAVKKRIVRAARPAFTLSGGMDSSSVLASAVKTTGKKQTAFSSVYSDKTYDETDEIRSMLEATVAQWHSVQVDNPDVFSLVEKMVRTHDEPVATATWLSHYVLCQEVQTRGFGSLFGGLGGDELNAGEYEHYLFHFADLRGAGKEEMLANEVRLWASYHDHPIYRKNFPIVEERFASQVDFSQPGRCLPDATRLQRYCGVLNPDYFDLTAFTPVMEYPFHSYLKNRTYQDLTRETAPCCLRAEDRQTAAFGLGNFLPFFDHRLVEFMFRVPGTYKIRNGVTKHLLRLAMKGTLPEETRTRIKKTGWNAPAHQWFAESCREPLFDLLHSQTFRGRGLYNPSVVETLLTEHLEIVSSGQPRENHMMFFLAACQFRDMAAESYRPL